MKSLKALTLFTALNVFAQQSPDFSRAPNSYIFDLDVAKSQSYGGILIPVKKAYAMWSNYEYLKENGNSTPIPNGNLSASLFWEDIPGLIRSVNFVPGNSPDDSKIKVEINKYLGKGNAVIAFKVNETIYWSWHIWVTDDPSNGVVYSQGFETDFQNNPIQVQYMDRNLGALNNHFLGNEWAKSGGLLYEWGRKDPFPALVYKDNYFYEIKSELGYLKHNEISNQTIPVIDRPYNEIEKNIKYSVNHPLDYLINNDNANWFSNKVHKIPGTGTNYTAWDLWSDNYHGQNGNASSSNATVRADSRSYELKSPLDPCPNGWRVPSNYGRVTVNNNHSPFGRKNSGGNDDIVPAFNTFYPDSDNAAFVGAKVYPGLGIDFTNAQSGNRNIGIMPISGKYEKYPNSTLPNAPSNIVYQDENSDGALWSATYGYDGVRHLGMISDASRTDFTNVGKHQVFINQTNPSQIGNAVRCMRDPNMNVIGDFVTNYYTETNLVVTDGYDLPNSYIIKEGVTNLQIPIKKPFAVFSQMLGQENLPDHNDLKIKILWTTNVKLITELALEKPTNNYLDDYINIKINPTLKGNFVISLHNSNGNNPAIWSWHIWVPDGDPTANTITYITEKPIPTTNNFVNPTKSLIPPLTTEFMDRNLGAELPYSSTLAPDLTNKTKGLLYQWGRKDPFPNINATENGKIALQTEGSLLTFPYRNISINNFYKEFTKEFDSYNNASIIDKNQNALHNLVYSIQHPMDFLYHSGKGALYDGGERANNDLSQIRDWVSAERSVLPERWGHGTKKSPFDPCPEGWRVPDTFSTILYSGSKGNSPFYDSYENDWTGKPGIIQDQWADVVQTYKGSINADGWSFYNQKYKVGSFSKDGIFGELGGYEFSFDRSGVWLGSLADLQTGYALGVLFQSDKMQTGTGVYPQAGMSVRCAKDEPRYLGIAVSGKNQNTIKPETLMVTTPIKNQVTLYPNPFSDELLIEDLQNSADSYLIYDMSGKLIKSGFVENSKINTTGIVKGIYIIKIVMNDQSTITKKVIRK